ncbi:MAG: hypothetical protein AAF456_02595 [Planctomycetota bacterium]
MLATPVKKVRSTSSARAELRNDDNVKFVDRAEFCRLLISSKSLNRCDMPVARVRGIYDPSLQLKYVIEEESLFHG